jgi:hypothetical protein
MPSYYISLAINLCINNSYVTKVVWEVQENWVPLLLINIINKNALRFNWCKTINTEKSKIHNKATINDKL